MKVLIRVVFFENVSPVTSVHFDCHTGKFVVKEAKPSKTGKVYLSLVVTPPILIRPETKMLLPPSLLLRFCMSLNKCIGLCMTT
jgi:hypothetical protein